MARVCIEPNTKCQILHGIELTLYYLKLILFSQISLPYKGDVFICHYAAVYFKVVYFLISVSVNIYPFGRLYRHHL
jgi:hypothetical protein